MRKEMTQLGPEQCFPKKADLYVEVVGDSTSRVAEHSLSLDPPIPPKSVVHDNGCGGGEVTAEMNPAANIDIYATDIDPIMVTKCRKLVSLHGWPVEATLPTVLPVALVPKFHH